MSAPRRYRLALSVLLGLALLAALYVAAVRERKELGARRVEIALDYADFNALAQSYGYDKEQFLVALRRAGLTSLAVSEELGGAVNGGSAAFVVPGQQLLAQARLQPLSGTFAALSRAGQLSPSEIYLVVFEPAELERYRAALASHLGPHSIRVIRASAPAILAIRSQQDYFNSLGLGLAAGPLALTRKLQLFLVPRVQNDERFGAADVDRTFASFVHGQRATTVIFFGQRNEVLGYPDRLADTAAALRRSGVNFGSIETYDKNQVQKGNEGLAEKAIERTTRVQAISKAELDKLDFNTVVARYLLGVRERNVRVIYLRPFLHEQNGMSLEKTNIELVRELRDGLVARGFRLGRATPIPGFRVNPLVIAVVSLAVPAIIMLLLEAFGIRRPRLAYALVAIDLLLVAAGYVTHHDLLVRKALALCAAIAFATMGVVAIPRAFTLPRMRSLRAAILAGLRTAGVATVFALAGALVVVGLVSVPLTMEEIDRFAGVKAVIIVPPVLAFLAYVFTRRFGNDPPAWRDAALAPVRVFALAAVALLAVAAFVYVSRSGNQSDVVPSAFELALRSHLTSVLGVRPRFKEFAIGFPLMMLLPALRLEHKRAAGWFFALGIAIGTSDIVDTFSHLHTPLGVSLTRLFNGAVAGILLGIVAIVVYRAVDARLGAVPVRRRFDAS